MTTIHHDTFLGQERLEDQVREGQKRIHDSCVVYDQFRYPKFEFLRSHR